MQELVKERQATATLKAKMAEQQRMLCKDLQVPLLSHDEAENLKCNFEGV